MKRSLNWENIKKMSAAVVLTGSLLFAGDYLDPFGVGDSESGAYAKHAYAESESPISTRNCVDEVGQHLLFDFRNDKISVEVLGSQEPSRVGMKLVIEKQLIGKSYEVVCEEKLFSFGIIPTIKSVRESII